MIRSLSPGQRAYQDVHVHRVSCSPRHVFPELREIGLSLRIRVVRQAYIRVDPGDLLAIYRRIMTVFLRRMDVVSHERRCEGSV